MKQSQLICARPRRAARAVFSVIAVCALMGCESIGYYQQAITGQMRLVFERERVESVLARHGEESRLGQRLVVAADVIAFAESQVGLAANGRYRTFVDLEGRSPLHNLFVAPALSLEAKQWCFPVAGCVPYLGYFSRARVEARARVWSRRGFDVYVGAVPAYSTLGWFDDPLMSSFVYWRDGALAELLLHELTHSRVWAPGDAAFNEALAGFVGRRAALEWLAESGRVQAEPENVWPAVRTLLLRARDVLGRIYADSQLSDQAKQAAKQTTLRTLAECFARSSYSEAAPGYQQMIEGANNALLVSIATYDDLIPAFAQMFSRADGNWPEFWRRVESLADLGKEARSARVLRLAQQQKSHGGDHERADQIQCEPLADHRINTEASGTEHDHVRRRRDG